jgi:hypothetical protein
MVIVEIFDEIRGLQSNLADVTMQCRLVVTGAKSQGTPISLDRPVGFYKLQPATRPLFTKINNKMTEIICNPQRILV